jgi:hypothetical protein
MSDAFPVLSAPTVTSTAAAEGDATAPGRPGTEPTPIPSDMQDALRSLVREYELESDSVRRHYVRRFRQAEEYWRGNQHLYWNEREFRWNTPFQQSLDQGGADQPRYDYVTNIYQAFGLAVVAAISQRLPRVRFEPVSALREEDLATARAASLVAELIERNNQLDLLAIREAYLLWTEGMFGAYVRYLVDDGYGTHEEPIYGTAQTKLRDAGYLCPDCATEAQSAAAGADESAAAGAGEQPALGQPCPRCGRCLGPGEYHPAEHLEVPVITAVQEVPNGQEKITIYGALNLKLMPYANDLRETGYLILAEEQHVAALRAAYPDRAEQISAGDVGGDPYERFARLSLTDTPGTPSTLPYASLITYKRCWLRPWSFWAHADPAMRQRLLSQFPRGCMVAFAGDVFLEARPESMDEHWRICRAMPGVGMYREPIGGSLLSIQQRINDIANLQAEHVEYGAAPPVLYDARAINGDALANKKMEPGSYVPVAIENTPAGKNLADLIFQPRIALDASIYAQGQDLLELSQFLTGALPAVFGGNMPDVTTAKGYSMARDQALGRLGLFWRQMKEFHAELMLAAVEVFRRNRLQDVEQVVLQRSGDYASRFIHLNELNGNVTCRPEADDAFPASWAEIRQNVIALMQTKDPYILDILSHPMNAGLVKNYLGTPGLVLPDDDNRSKQFREIDALLAAEPIASPTGMMLPVGEWGAGSPPGAQAAPDRWAPSVPVDRDVDNHTVHIQTIREWAVSDDGMEAKRHNPSGYANVLLHLLAHEAFLPAAPNSAPPAQ